MVQFKFFLSLSTVGSLFVGMLAAQAEGQSAAERPANPASELVTQIPRVHDIEPPLTNVMALLAQEPESQTIQITGVQITPSTDGFTIALDKLDGQLSLPVTTKGGKTWIADIPNAVPALPEVQEFCANHPTDDIATVIITQQATNIARVSVTGVENAPIAVQQVNFSRSDAIVPDQLAFRLAGAYSARGAFHAKYDRYVNPL